MILQDPSSFCTGPKFFSICYAQIFWDVVRLDLLTSKPHIRTLLRAGKTVTEYKCVFLFSLQLLSETFLTLRRTEWDIVNMHSSSCRVPVIIEPILMQLDFFWQIFEKYINTKFHENPSSGSRVVQCGRMEGRTDTTKLEVVFHNFTKATTK
jgi:hypothetical protein